uniref:Uncharacterized protein n=1 Tax=Oryza meridionalis TaxID=40149 RepID=A0A0E0EQP8_9ORYZ
MSVPKVIGHTSYDCFYLHLEKLVDYPARHKNGDSQDSGGVGTPCDDAHNSYGVDQVRHGRRMRGAPSAACSAWVGIGSSGTSSRGLIGCTTSKAEQDYIVRRRHMKDMMVSRLRHRLRCPQRRPCSHHQRRCSTSATRCRHCQRPCNCSSRLFQWWAAPPLLGYA